MLSQRPASCRALDRTAGSGLLVRSPFARKSRSTLYELPRTIILTLRYYSRDNICIKLLEIEGYIFSQVLLLATDGRNRVHCLVRRLLVCPENFQ